jgi:hypothetical protein
VWERCGVTVDVRVDLDLGADAGAEELDEATRDLLRELGELDVEASRVSAGPPPPGARAGDVIALGMLLLEFGATAIGPVAAVLQAWISRRPGRSIKLTLGDDSVEITGGSDVYQRQMLETFLAARTES